MGSAFLDVGSYTQMHSSVRVLQSGGPGHSTTGGHLDPNTIFITVGTTSVGVMPLPRGKSGDYISKWVLTGSRVTTTEISFGNTSFRFLQCPLL